MCRSVFNPMLCMVVAICVAVAGSPDAAHGRSFPSSSFATTSRTTADTVQNMSESDFVTTWKTTASGQSITIPARGTYTIEDNDTVSADATLRRLYLRWREGFGLPLKPSFVPTRMSYTASGVYRVNQITVEANGTDDGATVLFFDGSDTQLTDADSDPENGFQADLAVGANTIKVRVTAEDGETTETYTVVVKRKEAMASTSALLSNLDQRNTESLPVGDFISPDLRQAIGFQTGSNAGGYTLTSVKAYFRTASNSDGVRVRIFSSSASGNPDSSVYTLINPTISNRLNTFTAPANTLLEQSTQYFVVFDSTSPRGLYKLRGTNTDSLDSMAAGWSLGTEGYAKWANSETWFTNSEKMLIEINGAASTASTDATLNGLTLAGGGAAIALNETFASGTTSYTADVADTVDSIIVSPAKTDSNATIEYLDENDAAITDTDANTDALDTRLTVGENIIKIKVTARDGNTTDTYTVVVTRSAGTIVLNVVTIAGDDTVNIAEKTAGFNITGDTGSETGVGVSVEIGSETLTATSADDGNGSATWSVSVPGDASYITGTSLAVSVSAAKAGFTDAPEVERTLVVDLVAPTAPSYSAPTSLTVGEAIAAMNPPGGADIDGYSATGLPSGLTISDTTGVITGTPDTANADTTTATVTVSDAAGNTAAVDVGFPAVAGVATDPPWSTTLTVEARDGGRGYSRIAQPDLGAVSDYRFQYGSGTYEAQIVVAYADGVVFQVRNRGESLSALTLEWAGETLPLSAAARNGDKFTWGQTWLDANAASLNASTFATTLPDGGTGVVCLRTSAQTCPGTTITRPVITPAISVSDTSATEGYAVPFTVSLSAASSQQVTVAYTTSGGTATSGTDFSETSGTLTFAANETSKTVSVPTTEDSDHETDENFTLTLSNPTHATLGDSTATGTINDDDEAPPLTATFEDAAASHDGSSEFTVRVRFSEALASGGASRRLTRRLSVMDGSVQRVRRVDKRRDLFQVYLRPSGHGAMRVILPSSASCDIQYALCTSDGRALSSPVSVTVQGPPGLSVADAEVEEAPNAELAFVVTLDRAISDTVTVAWATSDGTAKAGADYTAASGTLTFAAGETEQTVSVAVLDDTHDEESEMMTLTLSASSGAYLADATATGTINNSDPLQRAWLSRFGRTVGTHVTDAVGERLWSSPGQGSHLTLGGYRLPMGRQTAGTATALAVLAEVAGVLGIRPDAVEAATDSSWLNGPGPDPRQDQSRMPDFGQAFDLRQVLLGSSFRLALNETQPATAMPRLTAWGRFAGTAFDGKDGGLGIDGDVFTGTVGVDGEWDRLQAGLAVAHSRGKGGYTMPGTEARGTGDLETALTSLHPYLRYAVTAWLDVWGMAGYGRGGSEWAVPEGTLEADTDFVMGAFGGRGILLAARDTGDIQLATRTDAMLTRTSMDAVAGLAETDADAHRVRVVLEGSRGVMLADGRRLTPTVELGLRHDSGDAETGFGLEVGGRVQYADPTLGLTLEGTVRGLLAHEDEDYREWGASGNVRFAPGAGGKGLALTLAPTWGVARSGIDGLWSRQTTRGLAPQKTRDNVGRLITDVGYRMPAPFGTGLLTPYVGTVLAEGRTRTYRVGTRLRVDARRATGLTLYLEGRRQVSTGQQPVNQGLRLQATWTF